MFVIRQKKFLENLETIRKYLCCYVGGPPCDCKYGVKNCENKKAALGQSASGGEETGCPEVSQATLMLNALSEEEFNALAKKARCIFVDELIGKTVYGDEEKK